MGVCLVVCRSVAALYRDVQVCENLKESDCSTGASIGYWRSEKRIPLNVVTIVAIRRWRKESRLKLGDGN